MKLDYDLTELGWWLKWLPLLNSCVKAPSHIWKWYMLRCHYWWKRLSSESLNIFTDFITRLLVSVEWWVFLDSNATKLWRPTSTGLRFFFKWLMYGTHSTKNRIAFLFFFFFFPENENKIELIYDGRSLNRYLKWKPAEGF